MDIVLNATEGSVESVSIRSAVAGADWDLALARLGGHTLQSAKWGEARRICDGIESLYWLIEKEGEPIWMARIETRRIPGIGRIAWVPRGPTAMPGDAAEALSASVLSQLRRARFDVLVTDPWLPVDDNLVLGEPLDGRPRTIWLDLQPGPEIIWKNFHTKIRNGVRKAESVGVITRPAAAGAEIERFVEICRDIERTKNFDARVSAEMLTLLLQPTADDAPVQTALLLACVNGEIGAGVVVARVGQSMSMLWAAVDRKFSAERVGEAAHWTAIRWGLERNCKRYDLEGIDAAGNQGVYRFKCRLGGREITLHGKSYCAVSTLGRLLLPVITRVVSAR